MKFALCIKIIATLLISATLYGCSSVKIIDINPDNQALILKSEMSGLSPSQTNTSGNWQSTLEYINTKLEYGEKVFYSTTFKKFVHAKFSDKFVLFSLNELNLEKATLQRQGGNPKRASNNHKIIIPNKNPSNEFVVFLASGKQSKASRLILTVDVASDAIKVKNAFELMSASKNKKEKTSSK